MSRQIARFAVGAPSQPRATVWRLWVQGAEAYLTRGTPGPSFKASFHRDGRCHYSLPIDHPTAVALDGSTLPRRYIEDWRAVAVAGADLTVPLRIVTPMCELRTAPLPEGTKTPITWIVPPTEACAVDILFAVSGAVAGDDWPGKSLLASRLIAKMSLATGRFLWAVWTPVAQGEEEFRQLVDERRTAIQSSRPVFRAGALDRSRSDTRLLIPIRNDDGQRAIIDASVHPQAA